MMQPYETIPRINLGKLRIGVEPTTVYKAFKTKHTKQLYRYNKPKRKHHCLHLKSINPFMPSVLYVGHLLKLKLRFAHPIYGGR